MRGLREIVREFREALEASEAASDDVIRVECPCGAKYRYNHGDTTSGAVGALAFMLEHERCSRQERHP